MELGDTHRDADHCSGNNADEEGARNIQNHQYAGDNEANYRQKAGAARENAQVNQGRLIRHHDSAALQSDEGDEQTDASSDRLSHRKRDGIDYRRADIGQGEDYEYDAFDQDCGQGKLPRIAHAETDRVAEECIQSHARGKRKWQFGIDCHYQGSHDSRNRRGGEQGVFIHPRC